MELEFILEFTLQPLQNSIMKQKNFLYVGSFFEGSTVNHRYRDLAHIFENIDYFNTNDFFPLFRRSLASIWKRLGFGPPYHKMLHQLSIKIDKFNPEIIFFDKCLYIPKWFFLNLKKKGIYLIHFSNDDQLNPSNQTQNYICSIPLYNLHITTKSYNVEELNLLNATSVKFINNATSNHYIYPIKISNTDKINYGSQVGFIGTYEFQRAESLLFLAKNGVKIRIWGSGWKGKSSIKHPNLIIEDKPLWGEDYLKVLCSTDINLNFLRKENRDLQTTRSIEIPASGAFMLAEYSSEHEKLFENNQEAVYFKDNLDLLGKVRFYLQNPKEIKRIALNGYIRCIDSNYFYKDAFNQLFHKLEDHVSFCNNNKF